MLDYMENLAIE